MHVGSMLQRKGSVVVTIDGSTSLGDAVAVLRDHGIGALPVVRPDGRIEGIVSERDVVRAVANHGVSALGRTVASVMTTEVEVCSPDHAVEHLMQVMTDRRIRHLPVVDDGRLVGIVSIGDVVKSRLAQLVEENRTLVDYINVR